MKTKQNKTKQNKTKQNKTKQNKTKQNKTNKQNETARHTQLLKKPETTNATFIKINKNFARLADL